MEVDTTINENRSITDEQHLQNVDKALELGLLRNDAWLIDRVKRSVSMIIIA